MTIKFRSQYLSICVSAFDGNDFPRKFFWKYYCPRGFVQILCQRTYFGGGFSARIGGGEDKKDLAIFFIF